MEEVLVGGVSDGVGDRFEQVAMPGRVRSSAFPGIFRDCDQCLRELDGGILRKKP